MATLKTQALEALAKDLNYRKNVFVNIMYSYGADVSIPLEERWNFLRNSPEGGFRPLTLGFDCLAQFRPGNGEHPQLFRDISNEVRRVVSRNANEVSCGTLISILERTFLGRPYRDYWNGNNSTITEDTINALKQELLSRHITRIGILRAED